MEDVMSVVTSPSYRRAMASLAFVAVGLAIAFIIAAFAFYGRARDVTGDTAEAQRWSLLFGTWRDSLTITVLFVSQGMLYRYLDFQTAANHFPDMALFYAPVLTPILSFVIDILIFAVAILRIITISRWLAAIK